MAVPAPRNRLIDHVTAIAVVSLFVKPIVGIGLLLAFLYVAIAGQFLERDGRTYAPYYVGSILAVGVAAPFLRDTYRRVLSFEAAERARRTPKNEAA